MESKKGKFHPMRKEKGRRRRKDHDPNQGVEGHIVDVQDQEAGNGQEVEGDLTAEEGGPTVEGGVHMKGDHLGGDHLPHIIGPKTLFLYFIDLLMPIICTTCLTYFLPRAGMGIVGRI